MSRSRQLRWIAGAGLALGLALVGCQPRVEPLQPTAAATTAGGAAASLESAVEAGAQPAHEWQENPRLAQIAIELDEQGRWQQTKVDYVAAGSERMLTLFLSDAGMREQRISLEPLDLPVLPVEAVEQLRPLPDGALPPARLLAAAEEAIQACALGQVGLIVYTTGAPATWDEQAGAWTQPPAWRAVLADADQTSVVVDPVSGAGLENSC